MINKRLLIKNLLAHNDESSFYDKKRQLNLHTREGKGKFLKHICALSNSNPTNNSYIVVGVEDQDNEIVGDDFFDDSRIQNLVNVCRFHLLGALLLFLQQNSQNLDRWLESQAFGAVPPLHACDSDARLVTMVSCRS